MKPFKTMNNLTVMMMVNLKLTVTKRLCMRLLLAKKTIIKKPVTDLQNQMTRMNVMLWHEEKLDLVLIPVVPHPYNGQNGRSCPTRDIFQLN